MDGKAKIETLTNSWYGYAVAAGIYSLLQSGIGFFSIFFVGMATLFSFFLTWFIGRRLLKKSGLTRVICIVVSAITSVLGTLGVAKMGWTFIADDHSMSVLAATVFGAITLSMHVRSLRVLTSSEVKSYYR
ncbi:MAG: hypothetical protein JWM74_3590 [Myxococcaceae bacterium]|jgi:hypothetical protein|nr:hypothetical protein [Myxococcaceae bacterium]